MDPGTLALLGLALRLILRGALIRGLRAFGRTLLVALGIRRITPRLGEPLPFELVIVPELPRDTGGAYRPKHRPQDPAKDPREPHGGESSSRGSEHGWANCSMSSGADVLAYQTGGRLELWGGDLRHAQGDLEGGTDLGDVRDAWAEYGETLKIRSGDGWDAVKEAHEDGRAIVIQGTGNVPGAGTFTGGHACSIAPETRSSDGAWLFGDPCVSDWQWIAKEKIRDWAEAWQSSIAFATSSPVAPPPEPEPEPEPPPAPCYSPAEVDELVDTAVAEALEVAVPRAEAAAVTVAGDELVGAWLDWLRAPRPALVDRWDRGSWADLAAELEDLVDGEELEDPCAPYAPASWSRGGLPFPAQEALEALLLPATWGLTGWASGTWRQVSDRPRRSRSSR